MPTTRRLLLAFGALALLDGCGNAVSGRATWRHAAQLPGRPTGGAASPSAAPVPVPERPVPGVCRPVPGITDHPGGPQHYVRCSGTDIALTIDDGPDPQWTPKILAVLDRYRIRATFSMIGRHAWAYPHLVATVAGAGHQIANHTFSHPIPLTRLAPAQIHDEINRTSDAIGAATGGHRPALFRAPGGIWSPAVLAACAQAGMRPLDWSVDPRDWARPGVSHIVDVILTRTKPGSIILDHDGGGNRQQTVDALTIALPRLLDAGYRFVQP
jgi:peptidoglycan/xylan/chitin deacetylase (PgdA/CDA1 family)